MGHTRLGTIPKSLKWNIVVSKITGKDLSDITTLANTPIEYVNNIARSTLDAAKEGLELAKNDIGLQYTFYLLTQITLSSRSNNWEEQLSNFDITLSEESSTLDLTTQIQNSIDDFLFKEGGTTYISEIAQKAAGEAITRLATPKAETLFGSGKEELRTAIKELSTKKGFAYLGQNFFGAFLSRFLNFYLSRITADSLGTNNFQQVGDITNFNNILEKHCVETSRIVHDFCGEWYSRTEFKEGIDIENTSRFLAVALNKLQAELKQQRLQS